MIAEKDINYYKAIQLISNRNFEEAFTLLYQCNPFKEPVNPKLLAYYGFCLAKTHNRIEEGIKHCRTALTIAGCDQDIHWVLAQLYLLRGDKISAVRTIYRGLRQDRNSIQAKRLIESVKKLVVRRPPVIRWLPRNNRLNIVLGKISYARDNRMVSAECNVTEKRGKINDLLFLPLDHFLFKIRIKN
jgi:hypothetical protein